MDWDVQVHGFGGSRILELEAQEKTFGDLRSWIGRFKGTDWGVQGHGLGGTRTLDLEAQGHGFGG